MRLFRLRMSLGNILTLVGIAIFVYEQWQNYQQNKRDRQGVGTIDRNVK